VGDLPDEDLNGDGQVDVLDCSAGTAILIGDGSELTEEEIEELGQLQAVITGVTVASPPVVSFTVTDEHGNPALGIDGGTTWFTFAKLVPNTDPDVNGGLPYWQSYVNRSEDVANNAAGRGSDVLDLAVQATTDSAFSGGTLVELGDGNYEYTFGTDVATVTTPIAVAWEPNLTHRVGLEIRLDGDGEVPLAPFNPVYDFVPDGGAGSGVTKNILETDKCNGCHYEFAFHGGPRKSMEYCVTCHNPGTVDQDSGNSLDFAHLAHSIHMGEDRTFDGTVDPFIIWGFSDFSHPYDEVTYPQSKTYCETCHTASAAAPDGDNWNLSATAKTCGGCHANGLVAANFDAVTGAAEYQFDHAISDIPALGAAIDGSCGGCHLGTINTAGDALSIHSRISGDNRFRGELGEDFVLEILGATNVGAGLVPSITFQVTDAAGTPYDIMTAPEFDTANGASLNLYVAWTSADIYNGDEAGGTGGLRDRNSDITEPPDGIADIEDYGPGHPFRMYLQALQRDIAANPGWANADGSYTVDYFAALPAGWTGDVMISLGGHPAAVGVTDANDDVGNQRAAPASAVFFPGTERQLAFESDKCNACHKQLQFHGSNRNENLAICLNCHNADLPEDGEGWAFGRLVHSIHSASTTFAGGAFMDVTYPQNVANCDTCHVAGSYDVARTSARAVSIGPDVDNTIWTDDIATTPNSAACGACHNDIASAGHFNTNGGQVGVAKSDVVTVGGLPNGQEACAVCHGTGSSFATEMFHNPGIGE
jgi:OmcA/MtrC family decaheme c-type cytochrome